MIPTHTREKTGVDCGSFLFHASRLYTESLTSEVSSGQLTYNWRVRHVRTASATQDFTNNYNIPNNAHMWELGELMFGGQMELAHVRNAVCHQTNIRTCVEQSDGNPKSCCFPLTNCKRQCCHPVNTGFIQCFPWANLWRVSTSTVTKPLLQYITLQNMPTTF